MRRTYSPANARLFVGETSEFHARLPSPLLPCIQLTKDSPSLPFRRFRPPELPAKFFTRRANRKSHLFYYIPFHIVVFSLFFFFIQDISKGYPGKKKTSRFDFSVPHRDRDFILFEKKKKLWAEPWRIIFSLHELYTVFTRVERSDPRFDTCV